MKKTIDARGLSCPRPVILVKQALEGPEGGDLLVIVDNEAARTNVSNLANGRSCQVQVEQQGELYYLTLTREAGESRGVTGMTSKVILLGSDTLGRGSREGSEELGRVLMNSFFYALLEGEDLPQALIMVNQGVFLACEGSGALEDLARLEEKGVEILSCGTCLDFYRQKDKLAVGGITNMYTILEKINGAEKVISL